MGCSDTIGTARKPFNPLLGETYEFIDENSKTILEQISHHPPILAFHTETPNIII